MPETPAAAATCLVHPCITRCIALFRLHRCCCCCCCKFLTPGHWPIWLWRPPEGYTACLASFGTVGYSVPLSFPLSNVNKLGLTAIPVVNYFPRFISGSSLFRVGLVIRLVLYLRPCTLLLSPFIFPSAKPSVYRSILIAIARPDL